jgi:hypothetical protein
MPQTQTAIRSDRANLTEKTARVRVDTSRLPCSVARSPFARLQGWYRNSVLRLLVLEGRSSLQRIGWIREIRAVERLG